MVTGHSPFPGSSATTVCFKVANREPVAASALDMTLPPQIDAVIARARAGAVYDLHDADGVPGAGARLVEYLPTLVAGLRAQGYALVPLRHLL